MSDIIDGISGFVQENPISTAVGAGVLGAVVGVGVGAALGGNGKKSSSKHKHTKKKTYKHRKGQRKPYTAGRGKDTSHRRIRFTKNNQPYIITRSGKARFIKRSSVSRARKRKGGRY